ncbi:hypothetical protein IV203_036271 [Nitzschia inconspicua]|uniref:Uncharacterized protein n=1 Tax=Nitzschia inconspicua TaxID=303405 RepID=A0A9K3LHT0_9STRA|nr:hypothetical protein IV203_036271 [Nitzschia inconspicua]
MTDTIKMPDGSEVEIHTTPPTVTSVAGVAHLTSADRITQTPTEQYDTQLKITKFQHKMYKKMDLHSPDLDSLVSLHTNLEAAERHFSRYDLLQIFSIVQPKRGADGKLTGKLVDQKEPRLLFQWYGALSLDDVIASTEWYYTFPTPKWYKSNLELTADYFRNHMDVDLYEKVNEEYQRLLPSQKGGPVLLFMMIRRLLSNNDTLVHALTSKIQGLKLSTYPGEDVDKAVTHLRTLVRCLKKLKRRNADGHEIDLVPFDLTKQLYGILQTSSCDDFNSMIRTAFLNDQHAVLTRGISHWSDPEEVLSMAQTLYHQLCTDGKWTGVTQNKATFPAFTKKKDAVAFLCQIRCHNCGGPHLLRECTEPQDEARIKANRKRFKDAKKVARTGSSKDKTQPVSTRRSKWPPRPKKGESNRTMIDGKLHYYHFKSSKWLPVDAVQSQQANVVAPSSSTNPVATTTTAAPSTAAPSADMDPTKRRQASLALTKFKQEFSDAFSVLTDVFQE